MKLKLLLLIVTVLGSKEKENVAENGTESTGKIEKNIDANLVEKITHIKYKKKSSKYIGVCYHKSKKKWYVQRRSKIEKKNLSNGFYADEETAAHASDTLARILVANGEQRHELNFPDDDTEVHQDDNTEMYKKIGFKFIGARSKNEKRIFSKGLDVDEKTTTCASDTLPRKLMGNGDQNLKPNFPDDDDEMGTMNKETPKFIGVSFHEKAGKWCAIRWSKHKNKTVYNGYCNDENTAARASDTLARKLIANGEQRHELNFPDDDTKVHAKKSPMSKFIGIYYKENTKKWFAARWSKREKKTIHNGYYNDEKIAARASDTLARKLMENGEHGHPLNFPYDKTEVCAKVRERELLSSMYVGVIHRKTREKWRAARWSKNAQKMVYNGSYGDEEIAAYASDTLARQLIAFGEEGHKLNFANTLAEKYKLNFPGADTEVNKYWKKKRKRPHNIKCVEF